jgi:exopolysaccharide production protein ExoQ
MPPSVAAVVFLVGIAGLFYLDRTSESKTSVALWIPIIWLSIAGSRMVSQWLSLSGGVSLDTPDAYLEGSPTDRLIFMGLLAVTLCVLIARSKQSGELLRQNLPIVIFFSYCLISVMWSDYPFVAFKRWTKALGNMAMVMLVLTDPNPRLALKRFLARSGFLLIPLSVLLIKYYPQYGRGYLAWVWTPVYTGVSVSKNGLGYICLLYGLAGLWSFLEALQLTPGQRRRRQLAIHGTILTMVGWLFWKANSATPLVCFLLGAALIILLSWGRRVLIMHVLAVAIPVGAFLVFVVLDLDTYLASALGRDASLTGRTELWAEVLRIHNAPLLGVGFESYWLGARAQYLWDKYWWHPNQAHNGYLETYLTLGWVGVSLLGLLLVSGYRHIIQTFRRDRSVATLMFALFATTIVYNFTEAALKGIHPLWVAFLLSVTAAPSLERREEAPTGAPASRVRASTIFETEWARAAAVEGPRRAMGSAVAHERAHR